MLDYFELLSEPRRPWLDVEALKKKFLTLSAEIHPDRAHGANETECVEANRRFAELNAAWQCLREPKDRLGHLLELETGARPGETNDVSPAAMDLFFEVGKICREADVFLSAKSKTISPLLKAQMFAQGMELADRLNELQQRIQARRDELVAGLKGLNAAWENAPAPGSAQRAAALPLASLEQSCRMLSYIARWSGQIQERVVRLSI